MKPQGGIDRRRMLALLPVVPALRALAGQQDRSAGKGKQLIESSLAALGGERFAQMSTRLASGRVFSFFHDQMSGLDRAAIYTEYTATGAGQGLAVRERELLGKKKDYSYLFLADQAWDITFRGARPIPDENWQNYRRSTETNFLYLMRSRRSEPGFDYDFVSSEVYLSRHVEIADITDAQGRSIRVYFDHNSHLPVRQIYNWQDEETRQRNEEITVFDKYRDIGGGIMWPFDTEREKNGYKTYQFFADSVQANVAIPPKMFDLPAGAKLLKKVE